MRGLSGYVTDPFAFVTFDGSFFWMLRSDTYLSMGRLLDVLHCDINALQEQRGRLHTQNGAISCRNRP